jgi:hypothetical protein
MGIEVQWSIEPDQAPIPDGQTVPHKVEVAEVAEIWAAGQRQARLRLLVWRACFIAFCLLVPLLIALSAAKHP